MKRSISSVSETNIGISEVPKKLKPDNNSGTSPKQVDSVLQDENLLYEILRHVDDARTLASSACVSKQWKKISQDERLWELICTKHSAAAQQQQLRLVVTALGGFRQLFSLYLWPLLKPSSSAPPPSSSWTSLPPPPPPPSAAAQGKKRWGKDEVNLSLSLLSISYYGKMNFNKMGMGKK
ncbi:hypothetical protein LIER_09650 [Lithospermum erythrorhizon]|uniref:F-box domain-containing protein n=1 Tax=Lithospermum erythrorhizon TaxID=34254 RepID=A0AAV3PGK6_LITER